MSELEPQDPPEDSGLDGQQVANQDSAPSPQDDAAERLRALEEQNRNLQLRLTEYGRKLKQTQEVSAQRQTPAEDSWDWSNPTGSVKNAIKDVLGEFEARQRSERESRELIKRVARQRNIPETELEDYYMQLQEQPPDPLMLADTVARMYQAEHVQTAITAAAKTAQQSAQRNARAVTTETGANVPTDAVKPIDQMSDDELEQFVKSRYGVAPRSA